MKFIKTFIRKLFSQHENEEGESQSKPSEQSYISFLLDENNEPHIKINIANTSSESAKQFGFMLNGINTGLYADDILQVLLDIGNQDVIINRFVRMVFVKWAELQNIYSKETVDMEPEIKPTEFLKGLKNGT